MSCCNACGDNNSNWKGGRVVHKRGNTKYVGVYSPKHPRASGQYVFEHILVAEKINGGPLPNGAVVHHVDGNGQNNDENNIQIMKNQSEHARLHAKQNCDRNECSIAYENDKDGWYVTAHVPIIGNVSQYGKTKGEVKAKIYEMLKELSDNGHIKRKSVQAALEAE